MTMMVLPYLFFSGRCEEAMNFYAAATGRPIDMLMRMKDAPEPPPPEHAPPGSENMVMHASMHLGEHTVLMASDDLTGQAKGFQGFSLSLTVPDRASADRIYAALSAGGQATMPMAPTFWSPWFGMLTDKFGVSWMISLPESASAG